LFFGKETNMGLFGPSRNEREREHDREIQRMLEEFIGYRQQHPSAQQAQHAQSLSEVCEHMHNQKMAGKQSLGPLSKVYRNPNTNIETRNPAGTLALIKKSIKEIEAEAVSEDAQYKVLEKIDRLENLGLQKQAAILEVELKVRVKLMLVKEWDYKVLPFEAIKKFVKEHRNWDGRGGYYKVHVEPLEAYAGDPEAKDKIIPDPVLDELETAQGRQVFDKFHVLRVEKVADPLLLGSIDGCKDFFFICEWGEDVSFDQIVKKPQ
jgi:hypothetical protein